ncbi:thioesterase family protein [Kibdelosporangium lantanae]
MGTFSAATAVTPVGPNTFDVELDGTWSIGTKLHGGYLLAVVARAAGELAEHPHLTAISGAFPFAPEPGPARVEVELFNAGRSQSQLRASLVQDGKVCLAALVTQGVLTENDPTWTSVEPFAMPPEDECPRTPSTFTGVGDPFRIPLMDVVETRLAPENAGFAVGKPGRTGSLGTYHRLADGTDWDPLSLLVALDPVPPITFDLGVPGWVPTLQMSAYIRRLPAPGSVKVRMTGGDITGNRLDETALAWDGKDRLVAQAVQFAGVRMPRG